MKYNFMKVFGMKFDTILLRTVLDDMAEEEIYYWFAKCNRIQGIKAFGILFDVKKRKFSPVEKELVNKILLRSLENEWVYDEA